MLVLILACEIGFWVLVVAGLVARYPLRAPRTGLVLLAATPVVDLVLLAATALHLRAGAVASGLHGLAALYIGFSLAYGHRMISWADTRFAHRFAGGPAPVRLHGAAHTRACWADVARTLLAVAVAGGLLLLLTAWVGDPQRTAALTGLLPVLGIVLAVELLAAVSYTLWPRRERTGGRVAAGSPS
ncbi:hypothetical protein [Kineococcus glutinatus]|uniref:Integral membrane protein n=1 Tax=Kineococcus glutinatus TaxID=1070872 RepID=A0ABP9HA30_9ACTN